jgi:hypothetical protein
MMGQRPIIIKSNGPLGRGMGAPGPENDFKQFTAVHFVTKIKGYGVDAHTRHNSNIYTSK